MSDVHQRLQAYAEFFEHLKPEDLQRFDRVFSETARFKDPFNDVRGLAGIQRVFAHMFEQCTEPRFHVTDWCGSAERGFLQWRFEYSLGRAAKRYRIEGLSRVCFDGEGLVSEHIDYWDPAEQLYSRLPVLGGLLGLVRKRLSAE
jgi:steroid delta-isomerase